MNSAVVLIVLSLNFFISFSRSEQDVSQSKSFSNNCALVEQKFQSIISTSAGHKSHDFPESVCHLASQSCCTNEMESAFRRQANIDLLAMLKKSGAHAKSALSSHIQFYYDHYNGLLRQTSNKTRQEINSIIAFSNHNWLQPMTQLFGDLTDALVSNINAAESVNSFLTDIFPDIFSISQEGDNTLQLTNDYRMCVKQELSAILPKPFGDKVQKSFKPLNVAIGAFRSFLRGLRMVLDMVDFVENYALSEKCTSALTRLTYCDDCMGYTSAKPCAGFCLNVLRGCLVEVRGLDHFYNEFINALHRLALNIHRHLSLEGELHLLPAHVSGAILHAIETSSSYYPQIVERCGEPPAAKPGQGRQEPITGGRRKSEVAAAAAASTAMAERQESLVRTLVSMKGLAADLGDNVCKTSLAADLHDSSCWNGTAIAPYLSRVPGNTATEQQAQNPEVSSSGSAQSPEIVSLKQKLSFMIRELNLMSGKGHMHMMQNDQPSDDEDAAGSASGAYDGDDTSGSGIDKDAIVPIVRPVEGAGPPTSDIAFQTTKRPVHPHPQNPVHAERPVPPLVDRSRAADSYSRQGAFVMTTVTCVLALTLAL